MSNKYILYTQNSKTEYNTLEEAKKAYDNCKELKFLYQPDKVYIVGTISSTGSIIGHDHLYHKDTAKCIGLFIAKNANQVKNFLDAVNWHHSGSNSKSSKARLYGHGPYGSMYKSNAKDNWHNFELEIQNYYLSPGNITSPYSLNEDFGAIDINKPEKYKGHKNPYRLN